MASRRHGSGRPPRSLARLRQVREDAPTRVRNVTAMVGERLRRDRARCIATALALSMPAVPARAADVGVVLDVRGKPSATDPSGHWRRADVLQGVHDGETVVLDPDEALVVCSTRLRAAVRIEGPGTVSIGATAVAVLVGSPRITEAGPCDDASPADENGGVILRGLSYPAPPGRR